MDISSIEKSGNEKQECKEKECKKQECDKNMKICSSDNKEKPSYLPIRTVHGDTVGIHQNNSEKYVNPPDFASFAEAVEYYS